MPIPVDHRRRGPIRSPGDERPHFVYRCYDSNGVLLYVGCSVTPVYRIDSHRENSWWGDRIDSVRFTVFPDRDYALSKEREAIWAERPVCNVKGRWYRRDPRHDWLADDYVTLHAAVVAAARGLYGTRTRALLQEIESELKSRFGVSLLGRRSA